VPIAEAMEFITNMRSQLTQLKLQESSIRKGLNIFKIDQPPSHIIVGLDKVCIFHYAP
jgi:dynein heavy chain